MKNRNTEKYDVNYSHTGRLKNSAIPYMQRLINKDAENLQEYGPNKRIRRPG